MKTILKYTIGLITFSAFIATTFEAPDAKTQIVWSLSCLLIAYIGLRILIKIAPELTDNEDNQA